MTLVTIVQTIVTPTISIVIHSKSTMMTLKVATIFNSSFK